THNVEVVNKYYPGTNGTAGNFAGELAYTAQEWVDGGLNVVGQSAPTYYDYDANGNRTVQTQVGTVNGVGGQQVTTRYYYDGMNRLIETVDPLNRTSMTTYDGAGHVITSTDVLGRTTTNVYDAIGNLIETDYPDGTVSRMTYDEMNHVVCSQDKAFPDGSGKTTGPATWNVYDGAGRNICVERLTGVQLQRVTDTNVATMTGAAVPQVITLATGGTLASFTRSVYDWDGRVIYSVAANGGVTQYQYDAAGRRTNTLVYTNYFVTTTNQAISPSGGALSTVSVYDANGNQVAMIDANTNETDYTYDGGNRLTTTTYPLNAGESTRHQTASSYDSQGNKLSDTDEAGVVTAYSYYWRGLLTSVTLDGLSASGGAVWNFGYDEFGNLVRQSDPNGGVISNQYDALGRRTMTELSDGSKELTSYEEVAVSGGVYVDQMSVTDERQKTIVTTDDVMGRVATKVYPPINPGETNTVESCSYT